VLFNKVLLGDELAAKEKEIDVLKHELAPEHRVLPEGEKQKLLEKFGITIKQLPKVLDTDPVAKQMNLKAGDVLEIKRKSISAGTSIYYRHVVA